MHLLAILLRRAPGSTCTVLAFLHRHQGCLAYEQLGLKLLRCIAGNHSCWSRRLDGLRLLQSCNNSGRGVTSRPVSGLFSSSAVPILVATAFSYEASAVLGSEKNRFCYDLHTHFQLCLVMTSLTNDIHFNMSAVFQPSDLKRLLEGKDDL